MNQSYLYFESKKFCRIAFGAESIRVMVHNDFQMILVTNSQTIIKKMDWALINRFEKHVLNDFEDILENKIFKRVFEWYGKFIKRHES